MKKIILIVVCVAIGINSWAQDNSIVLSETKSLQNDFQSITSVGYSTLVSQDVIQEEDLYNGHNYDYYNAKYIRAASAKKTGIILTLTGAGAGIVGLVTSALLAQDAYGGENEALFVGGVFMFVAGVTVLNVGIPFWVAGGIKKSNNRKAMEKGWPKRKPDENVLSFGTTKNGVGFILKL
jgi:hypothetical protein